MPNKLANSYDTTRKRRDTRDQRKAQEMDYRQRSLDRALQLETCSRGASQRCTYGIGVILSVAYMQHNDKTS